MLLAAQQALPSRALTAQPARRWAPEEMREGCQGLLRSRRSRTKHQDGCYPPGKAAGPACLPLLSQGCAHSPPSGSGVLPGPGIGPCFTPGQGLRTATRGGPGRSGGGPTGSGDLPHSGHLSGAPAGVPLSEPCKNG